MLRPWLVVALFLMVAGCSSSPEVEEVSPTTTASTSSTTGLAQVQLTDTLHLLDPPHMAATLPVGGTLIRTPVPSDVNSVTDGYDMPVWSLPRPPLETLVLKLDLWVDVQGSVSNPPRPVFTAGTPPVYLSDCFWRTEIHLAHADGTLDYLNSQCFAEPQVVPTGARLLQSTEQTLTPEVEFSPGDRIEVSIFTWGAYGPGATVDVLSGVPEHDSTVSIASLQVPLNTLTLTH